MHKCKCFHIDRCTLFLYTAYDKDGGCVCEWKVIPTASQKWDDEEEESFFMYRKKRVRSLLLFRLRVFCVFFFFFFFCLFSCYNGGPLIPGWRNAQLLPNRQPFGEVKCRQIFGISGKRQTEIQKIETFSVFIFSEFSQKSLICKKKKKKKKKKN